MPTKPTKSIPTDNPINTEDTDKNLNVAIDEIIKEHGKGSIMRLGDPEAALHIVSIPTGALSLDIALGVGGVPRGRITEIFGPESAGKSTLAGASANFVSTVDIARSDADAGEKHDDDPQ